MVKSVLSTESFYFCTAYDLSHTLQRIRNAGSEFKDVSLFERVPPCHLPSDGRTSLQSLCRRRVTSFGIDICYRRYRLSAK